MATPDQEAVAENARSGSHAGDGSGQARARWESTGGSSPFNHARPRPISSGPRGEREIAGHRRRRERRASFVGLFFEQTGKDDLYATALTIESLNDRRAVPPLIRALLHDDNPHRRHAAARALGWIHHPGRATALALAQCLVDSAQPQPAREEAAESLAYAGTRESIEPLISVLHDPDVRIRFWAVFGLGRSCRGDMRAIRALESVLGDGEAPPGNWWPVGKEALAMLAAKRQPPGEYETKLSAELERVLADPNATAEDRRWAEFYR